MKVISQRIKDAQSMWPKRVFCDECYAELEVEERRDPSPRPERPPPISP